MVDKYDMELLDESILEKIAGGIDELLPSCKVHDWVFTGSSVDVVRNITWNNYACSKCGTEKRERL